eukprot:1200547-Rhodomonas_salina.3
MQEAKHILLRASAYDAPSDGREGEAVAMDCDANGASLNLKTKAETGSRIYKNKSTRSLLSDTLL